MGLALRRLVALSLHEGDERNDQRNEAADEGSQQLGIHGENIRIPPSSRQILLSTGVRYRPDGREAWLAVTMTERLSVVKAGNARLVPFDHTRVAHARVLDAGYERPGRERPPGRSTAGRLVTDAVEILWQETAENFVEDRVFTSPVGVGCPLAPGEVAPGRDSNPQLSD